MSLKRKVWIIVTQDGDLGEGGWSRKEDAERYLENEVGVVAGLLQVYESTVTDLRRISKLAGDIQYDPEKFRRHL